MSAKLLGWQIITADGKPALDKFDTAVVYANRDQAKTRALAEGDGARLVDVELVAPPRAAVTPRGRRPKQQEE